MLAMIVGKALIKFGLSADFLVQATTTNVDSVRHQKVWAGIEKVTAESQADSSRALVSVRTMHRAFKNEPITSKGKEALYLS